jgi:hypothetical protein
MTAFFADRLLNPREVPAAATSLPTPPATRPGSITVFALLTTVLRAISEWVFLLSMIPAIALFVLIAAGASGLLG